MTVGRDSTMPGQMPSSVMTGIGDMYPLGVAPLCWGVGKAPSRRSCLFSFLRRVLRLTPLPAHTVMDQLKGVIRVWSCCRNHSQQAAGVISLRTPAGVLKLMTHAFS